MRRIPGSRWFYLVAGSAFAAVIFGVADRTSSWVGLAFAMAGGLAAGYLVHRVTADLTEAVAESERRSEQVAEIRQLSAGYSGALGPAEIAATFLQRARRLVPASVSAALAQFDESAASFRVIAEDGPRPSAFGTEPEEVGALPEAVREKLTEEHRSFVVPDTAAEADWGALLERFPALKTVRCFAALPLVSRSRLVGLFFLQADEVDALGGDALQLLPVLGQYVAGALHSALSLTEADARAEREAVVNRIIQRMYANLEPDAVVRSALEELGTELHASRVIISSGAGDDLAVLHEWDAPGVEPVGIGARGRLPLSALSARQGRTLATRDARVDDALGDPSLGSHGLIEQGTIAAVATPIGLGGHVSGVLVLDHVGGPRIWTRQEIRLLETVARELRTALEAAGLMVARQRENERMLALHRASSLVASSTDPIEVLGEILRAATSLLGRGAAAVYLWDPAAEVLRLAGNVHAAPGTAPTVRLGQGVGGLAFERQEPVIVNDYPALPRPAPENVAAGWRAALSVPLARAGRKLGVLTVGTTDASARFDDQDARLLSLFGDQAIAALTTAELVEQQKRAVEELGRLSQAKSDFVSVVSHEFRTPLTGIQGFSEMLRDDALSPGEVQEYAGEINKESRRLARMINQMLDLDRLESGRVSFDPVPVDLNLIVSEVVAGLQPTSPNHRITLDLEPGLRLVSGERDQLTQVAVNLLSNAVKYSPKGGEISAVTRTEGELAHLLVRDHGLGIPAAGLEVVFERYARLGSDQTRFIQGTGLGLPIVRQIITRHGGRTWAESIVGEGSTFHVTIPFAVAAAE